MLFLPISYKIEGYPLENSTTATRTDRAAPRPDPGPWWLGQHEDDWDELLKRYAPEVLAATDSAV